MRIGATGNAGQGNPAINALAEVIGGIVGDHSIGEVQEGLASRGAIAEIPPPTYGYMRRDEFYTGSLGDNLSNEWVPYAMRGLIYSGKVGRNTSADTYIRQLPWGGREKICARRWHMRYTRGVVYKEGPYGQLAELQIDTVALQRGLLVGENAKAECMEEKRARNERLVRKIDSRWES